MSSVAVEMLLTGVMVLTPTVMFVGFYRGLMAMRDEDLVNQLMMHENVEPPENRTMAKAMGLEQYCEGRSSTTNDDLGSRTLRCRHCAAENPAHVDFCAVCLQQL